MSSCCGTCTCLRPCTRRWLIIHHSRSRFMRNYRYIGPYAADNSLLEVQQAAFQGESGSPLIDTTGAVVATALERLNLTTALYLPIRHAEALLTKIPMRDSISALDKSIREEEIAKKKEWLVHQLRY